MSKIASATLEAVLKGPNQGGPPSLKSRWARARYQSPTELSPAFDEAMKVVEDESAKLIARAQSLQSKSRAEQFMARAMRNKPEVRLNFLVQSQNIDLDQPVYKMLASRQWQQKPMLVLMQRLEQHGVIPDTMPTLRPQADVGVQFRTPNQRMLEPGEWISNDVCSRRPEITIRDFGVLAGEQNARYTVLIVNPDTPDLEKDGFSTYVHFAATNVKATLKNPVADYSSASIELPYIPPHPEKNAGAQRVCVWVFRQKEPLQEHEISREFFDIRKFATENNLRAVGASLWRSKWDLSSPSVREKYGLPKGRVFFRARTEKPEEALLHVRERPKWQKIDGV